MSERKLTSGLHALRPEVIGDLDHRIAVPRYDRGTLGSGIVHVGVGGFHRAHQAEYLDDLCNEGVRDWSITGAGVLATDAVMAKVLAEQSGLYTLVTRSENETSVRVIGTLTRYLHAFPRLEALIDVCVSPSTRIVSLTITEGGYPVEPGSERAVKPSTSPVFAAIATALQRRRLDGQGPFTVLSCDNVLNNGEVAKTATIGAAEELGYETRWLERDGAFPNSMVDRITPATTSSDRGMLVSEYGLNDGWPVMTEPFRQWVIEDEFSLGRPPWEEVGAMVTSDVAPYERMKLRVLNAGHSTLAYLAALAGHELVHEATADPLFARFLGTFLREEAVPVLPPVPDIDIESYVTEVITRFSNPSIRDQIARLCLDGSSKFPTFLIPTIRAQLEVGGPIEMSAMALAGWCHYLAGKDDAGREIQPAPDSMIETAISYARASVERPEAFLGFAEVFGDLASSQRLRETFEASLRSLRTNGARATLHASLGTDLEGNR